MRLVAKAAYKQVVDEMAELLASNQLGYSVHGGSEAAFLNNMDTCQVKVKLDLSECI